MDHEPSYGLILIFFAEQPVSPDRLKTIRACQFRHQNNIQVRGERVSHHMGRQAFNLRLRALVSGRTFPRPDVQGEKTLGLDSLSCPPLL